MSIDLENMLSHERKRVEFIQLKKCLRSDLSTVHKKRGYQRLQYSFLW